MQGISGQHAISVSSGASSSETRSASSDSVASCFIDSFSRACNTVSHRSTDSRNISKYASPVSSRVGENINNELLKAEYRKKLGESNVNSSSNPTASSFVQAFSSACNAVTHRSTTHEEHSSPWHNERRSDYSSKSSFTTSTKNAYYSRNHSSSYRCMSNDISEKYREDPFGKTSYHSR